MAIKPIGNNVLARVVPVPTTTPGGIALSQPFKERSTEAVVVESGPGMRARNGKLVPTGVSAGDTIIFAKGAGEKVRDGVDELIILDATGIHGIKSAAPHRE